VSGRFQVSSNLVGSFPHAAREEPQAPSPTWVHGCLLSGGQLAAMGPAATLGTNLSGAPPREVLAHSSRANSDMGRNLIDHQTGICSVASIYQAIFQERNTTTGRKLAHCRDRDKRQQKQTPPSEPTRTSEGHEATDALASMDGLDARGSCSSPTPLLQMCQPRGPGNPNFGCAQRR
jgi:hypothetical protein